jgi:hypothetical protein
MFEASTTVAVGSGSGTWLWRDNWLEGRSINSLAPDLVATVDKRAVRVRTVAHALQGGRWVADITGSLSMLGLQQYTALWECLQAINPDATAADRLLWKWALSNQYTASSAYRAFFIRQTSIPHANELHKVRAST